MRNGLEPCKRTPLFSRSVFTKNASDGCEECHLGRAGASADLNDNYGAIGFAYVDPVADETQAYGVLSGAPAGPTALSGKGLRPQVGQTLEVGSSLNEGDIQVSCCCEGAEVSSAVSQIALSKVSDFTTLVLKQIAWFVTGRSLNPLAVGGESRIQTWASLRRLCRQGSFGACGNGWSGYRYRQADPRPRRDWPRSRRPFFDLASRSGS